MTVDITWHDVEESIPCFVGRNTHTHIKQPSICMHTNDFFLLLLCPLIKEPSFIHLPFLYCVCDVMFVLPNWVRVTASHWTWKRRRTYLSIWVLLKVRKEAWRNCWQRKEWKWRCEVHNIRHEKNMKKRGRKLSEENGMTSSHVIHADAPDSGFLFLVIDENTGRSRNENNWLWVCPLGYVSESSKSSAMSYVYVRQDMKDKTKEKATHSTEQNTREKRLCKTFIIKKEWEKKR